MKSLKESLFDRDLVEKDIPGHQLKDIVYFDGQWVYKLLSKYSFGFKNPHVLEIIDWKLVRWNLKKWGGDKLDLGLYAYANADTHNIRNADTNKKTENFARLIMSIPYIEEVKFGGFNSNSRFSDEFLKKLDNYILPNWRRDFHFELITTRFGLIFTLHYAPWGDQELLRFEFLKNSLKESLFDKDLVTNKLDIEVKYDFLKRIKSIYDKYNISYELVNNKFTSTQTLVAHGPEKIFQSAFEVNGKSFDVKLFMRPEFTVPVDSNFNMDALWEGNDLDLWIQIIPPSGVYSSYIKLQQRLNEYAKITPLSYYAGLPFSDEMDFVDYLEQLEKAINTFNSEKFINKAKSLINKYYKEQKSIPLAEFKKLASML